MTIARYYTPSGRSIQKPYDDGEKDYNLDYYQRYTSGELFSADSVEFDESLAYETSTGRTVYGGGGIMPDYFVSLDTTDNSSYINRLAGSNSVREFTLEYRDNNPDLKSMDYQDFDENFIITEKMLDELITIGNRNGVRFQAKQYKKSKELLAFLLKAQIARDIYNDDAFYKVFNNTNEIYREALRLFDNTDALLSKPNGSLLQTK